MWASGSLVEHPVLTSASGRNPFAGSTTLTQNSRVPQVRHRQAAPVPSTGAHNSTDLAPVCAHPETVQKSQQLPSPTPALRRLEEEYWCLLQTRHQWDSRGIPPVRYKVSAFSLGVAWLLWTSHTFYRVVHCFQKSCFYNIYVGTLASISCQCRNTQYKKEVDFCCVCLDFTVLINFFSQRKFFSYEIWGRLLALYRTEQSSR